MLAQYRICAHMISFTARNPNMYLSAPLVWFNWTLARSSMIYARCSVWFDKVFIRTATILSKQTSKQANKQASKQAGKQASERASKQADRQTGRRAGRQAGRQACRQAGGQAGRQAGRQAGSQAGRQAGRQTGRQAGRQAGRQTDKLNGSCRCTSNVLSNAFPLKSNWQICTARHTDARPKYMLLWQLVKPRHPLDRHVELKPKDWQLVALTFDPRKTWRLPVHKNDDSWMMIIF